jgi:ABC-type multidrug transport system ATPase subunit
MFDREKPVHSARLSGGRMSIGLALFLDPVALLLDEPTSRLDSSSARVVMCCHQRRYRPHFNLLLLLAVFDAEQ